MGKREIVMNLKDFFDIMKRNCLYMFDLEGVFCGFSKWFIVLFDVKDFGFMDVVREMFSFLVFFRGFVRTFDKICVVVY